MARPRRLSTEKVNEILRCMTDRLSITEIIKQSQSSSTTVYKVIAQFPMWSFYLKTDEE